MTTTITHQAQEGTMTEHPAHIQQALDNLGLGDSHLGQLGHGWVKVDTAGAAAVANQIHDTVQTLTENLAQITRYAEEAQAAIADGRGATKAAWVLEPGRKVAEAQAKLETLIGVARYLLSKDQLVLAHSTVNVYFAN